ncbi:MAG: hypothetical protein O7A03_11145, partial [Alphaproteobacteria bacterium]|nr:hypothetical protein [Alphaproteobacteria bacterium]
MNTRDAFFEQRKSQFRKTPAAGRDVEMTMGDGPAPFVADDLRRRVKQGRHHLRYFVKRSRSPGRDIEKARTSVAKNQPNDFGDVLDHDVIAGFFAVAEQR